MKIKSIIVFLTFIYPAACGQSPMSNIPLSEMTSIQYFSADYFAARQKFIDSASTSNASLHNYQNPHPGPGNRQLVTDVASCGRDDAENVLVLMSGTHGVEGFAGSGIQTGLLREGLCDKLPANTRMVLIHALNPYGFAFVRRFNEDNVDLNRNFLDHTSPYPNNPEYDDLADVIAPESLEFQANLLSMLKIFWLRLTRGQEALQKAITFGQYNHSEGLFYGGNAATWSNKILHEIASRFLTGANKVIVIDFHTGLGPYGHGEIILNDPVEDPAYKRARAWWGDDRVKSTVQGESVSAHLSGTVKLVFDQMLPDAEVTGVGLEFGTIPAMKVFFALRAENWLHHHGSPAHPRADKIKAELREAFYPDDDAWKLQVWKQGSMIVELALKALAG